MRKESQIAAFILYDKVKLYGGFNGNETERSQRDPLTNTKILLSKAGNQDYFYSHVVYGANNTVLDGLVIRYGKASGLLAYQSGKIFRPHNGGIGFTMTINNCRFENNVALEERYLCLRQSQSDH